MKAAIRSSALARIFLVAGFGVALSAMPANAQKAGRQHHRRPRTRYPRFRSAQGRRVRHRGTDRIIRDLRYAHRLSTPTASRNRSSRCPGSLPRTSRPGPSSCVPASNSTTARRSTPKRYKANFDRQKDPANKCRCAFYISNVNNVQAPDELTLVYNLNDPSVNFPAIGFLTRTRTVRFTLRRPGRPRAMTTTAIPLAPVPIS